MAMTVKKIAELAGVSVGTVDRALNMLPELVDKLSGMLGKKESAEPAGEAPQEQE